MIRIENVTKTYIKGDKYVKALDNISLSASKGEFIVVKGPSGCGKTTLLLATGGLLHPQEGKVFINDQDLYKLSTQKMSDFRSSNIGFVFQQYHLIPYLSILENITVPSLAHQTEIPEERAIELIEDLGLKERLHHTPGELSAGEKQRTSLARAILYSPKVILADEITGNLDDKNSSIVLNKLAEFSKSGGTVMLVTHDEKAFAYADRIVEMEK
jgi:ABC-type lipoprotein export system ATPase subunit